MKALIVYWSASGNTEKAAFAIGKGLQSKSAEVDILKVDEALDVDLYKYDFVCLGAPVYQWHPAPAVGKYIKEKFNYHKKQGDIRLGCPRIPGKKAAVFVTYSGPHTGMDEAVPACKYMGQFFAHIGIEVIKEWYIIGEYHGKEGHSTLGPLGDIRGRPNEQDLRKIEQEAAALVNSLGKS